MRSGLLNVRRSVEVAPDRLAGWVERYVASHPGAVPSLVDGTVLLSAPGAEATATLRGLLPVGEAGPDGAVEALVAQSDSIGPVAVVLIRRGGYGVGVAAAGELLASKVGTRYVQSRTAAGGWSQQRYARRRDGQARELVDAAAAAWAGLALPPATSVGHLVTGGDRALVDRLLADRRLPSLPPARHLDVPDPRAAVLAEAARRAIAIQVTVVEPG